MIPCWYQWNSDWSKLCIPYCTEPCAIRSGRLSCFEMSRMLSCTAAVLISTSDPGTRPWPSFFGTSRSDTTAASAVERRWRISSCWCGGKNEITRLIVCVQSVVWSVENTRCPVSAALRAVSSVSMSRISPMRMTSGACRSTWRSAALNDSVSFPTSRCEMFARLSRCRNSIGSSIVMILTRRLRLMWLTIAASAVDFPDPVSPVTSTSPRGLIAISSSTAGRFKSRIVLTSYGIDRNANATVPRCWYTFVRNRPTPGTPIAKSASLCSANSLTCRGVMICSASDFSSSGLSGAVSSDSSSPFTRMVAGRPTLSSRSDALRWTICVMACLKLKVAPVLAGASGMRVHPEKRLSELDRLGVLHTYFAHQPGDFGLDFVHDLHRFDDAHDLPGGDAAAGLHIGVRPRLGSGIEGPDHRRLDVDQLRLRGGRRRRGGGGARNERPSGRLRDHQVRGPPAPAHPASRVGPVAHFRDPDRRPPPQQTPAHLDRPELRGILQDLNQLRDDGEVHRPQNLHEFDEFRAAVRQEDRSRGRQMHVVFDPHTALPGEIHARLDRHHRADGKGVGVRLRQPRRLVHFESQPVPERVTIRLPEPAPCAHGP